MKLFANEYLRLTMAVIQALNQPTFEALFKSSFKSLCFFALKYVKDMDVAKEIAQDAFINLWEKRETIDLSKSVKSYLTTTVYNRSLNYLRDNKKFNNNILSIEGLFSNAGDYDSDKLVVDELNQAIKNAIDELPEKCREVFLLSRNENLKYQQIADKLQISIKTVEAQMSKALQHLRLRLAEFISVALILYLTVFKK